MEEPRVDIEFAIQKLAERVRKIEEKRDLTFLQRLFNRVKKAFGLSF